jgi:acyl-CoA synthetase (AMP-forming)/AMP-acid ligase II
MGNSPQINLAQRYESICSREKERWREFERLKIKSWADVWEQSVDKQPQSCVVEDLSTAQSLTYKSLDQEADKITAWAITTKEQYIGVCQPNGAVFLAVVLGLIKAGVTPVLFNTREPFNKLLD